jgi:uncharacterized protein
VVRAKEIIVDRHRVPDEMDIVETSFARLYRTSDEVFKVRKPVRLALGGESVDLTSLESRRRLCAKEDRIDRILAPDVTRGLVSLTHSEEGVVQFGEEGELVDWALRMHRLPDAERADRRLAEGRLTDEHLRNVAHRLAALHERTLDAAPANPAGQGVLDRLRTMIEMRIDPLDSSPVRRELPLELEAIESWQLAFLDAQAKRLIGRATSAAMRQEHGELALEHVFVDDAGEVRILAGLEMGPRWRDADVAADVALLATDLSSRHRVDLAERFVAEYARIANDFDLYPVLDFHSSLRASLRGKLDWFCAEHLAPSAVESRRYRERARRFFRLAAAAPRRPLLPPCVVVMGGQVASGKSTIATEIGRRIGAPIVGSDPTRDFLLGSRVNEELHEMRWEESYAPDFGERVYAEVLRRAGEVLDSGRPVVIDGCFRSREQRARARQLAERFDQPFLFIEAWVAEDVQLERLAERALRDDVPLAAWTELADRLRGQWEPADDLDTGEHLFLDTALPLSHNAQAIEAILPTWPSNLTG